MAGHVARMGRRGTRIGGKPTKKETKIQNKTYNTKQRIRCE
jgi:hypothetical protein